MQERTVLISVMDSSLRINRKSFDTKFELDSVQSSNLISKILRFVYQSDYKFPRGLLDMLHLKPYSCRHLFLFLKPVCDLVPAIRVGQKFIRTTLS